MTNKLLERLKAKLWCLVEQEPEIYGELYQLANSVKGLELSEEVMEAMDELRKLLFSFGQRILSKIDDEVFDNPDFRVLGAKALKLLNTLEAMEESRPSETNKLAAPHFKIAEKKAIFARPCESKAEDSSRDFESKEKGLETTPLAASQNNATKEEAGGNKSEKLKISEAKSIWKPVDELFGTYQAILVQDSYGTIELCETLDSPSEIRNRLRDTQAKNFATLTDFINAFEQMQKDIQELKNK